MSRDETKGCGSPESTTCYSSSEFKDIQRRDSVRFRRISRKGSCLRATTKQFCLRISRIYIVLDDVLKLSLFMVLPLLYFYYSDNPDSRTLRDVSSRLLRHAPPGRVQHRRLLLRVLFNLDDSDHIFHCFINVTSWTTSGCCFL